MNNNLSQFLDEYNLNGILNVKFKKINKKVINGYSNMENETKITNDTIFPLGSISKLYYGTLIVILLDQKMISSLNDSVRTYLPEFKLEVTILDCLLHTSGITEIRMHE